MGDRCSFSPDVEGVNEIISLSYLYMIPMALRAVVRLAIPDILAKAGPGATLSVREIVDELPPSEETSRIDRLERVLQLLAQQGVFKETVADIGEGRFVSRFGLTKVSQLLVTGNEVNMSFFVKALTHQAPVTSSMFLDAGLLNGGNPFLLANKQPYWDYVRDRPDYSDNFFAGLSNRAKMYNRVIADRYEGFRDIKTLVDVGGGKGDALAVIVATHPHIHGTNFDQPSVLATAPKITGVDHVEGNFFEEIPHGDALLLQQVLHDWNDEECLVILKNCRKALSEDGKLIIRDFVLGSTDDSSVKTRMGYQLSVAMQAFVGGKERNKVEWQNLISAAGFSHLTFMDYSGLDVLEARK